MALGGLAAAVGVIGLLSYLLCCRSSRRYVFFYNTYPDFSLDQMCFSDKLFLSPFSPLYSYTIVRTKIPFETLITESHHMHSLIQCSELIVLSLNQFLKYLHDIHSYSSPSPELCHTHITRTT